jgi:hypothetical protein
VFAGNALEHTPSIAQYKFETRCNLELDYNDQVDRFSSLLDVMHREHLQAESIVIMSVDI